MLQRQLSPHLGKDQMLPLRERVGDSDRSGLVEFGPKNYRIYSLVLCKFCKYISACRREGIDSALR